MLAECLRLNGGKARSGSRIVLRLCNSSSSTTWYWDVESNVPVMSRGVCSCSLNLKSQSRLSWLALQWTPTGIFSLNFAGDIFSEQFEFSTHCHLEEASCNGRRNVANDKHHKAHLQKPVEYESLKAIYILTSSVPVFSSSTCDYVS